jgi:chaperonin GroES
VADPKFEIQMLHDRVLIRPVRDSGEQRTAGGIVIPATAEQRQRLVWGEVSGTGPFVRSVKAGDKVLFHPDEQFEVDIQGETYLVMRERDLHATATERPEHGIGLYL